MSRTMSDEYTPTDNLMPEARSSHGGAYDWEEFTRTRRRVDRQPIWLARVSGRSVGVGLSAVLVTARKGGRRAGRG